MRLTQDKVFKHCGRLPNCLLIFLGIGNHVLILKIYSNMLVGKKFSRFFITAFDIVYCGEDLSKSRTMVCVCS